MFDPQQVLQEVEKRFTERYRGCVLTDSLLAVIASELRSEGWPIARMWTEPATWGVCIRIEFYPPSS